MARRRLQHAALITGVFTAVMLWSAPVAFAQHPGAGNSDHADKATTQTQNSQQNQQPSNQSYQQPETQAATSHPSSASQATYTNTNNQTHSQGNAGTSGTYSQPQPYSHADQNNTGANDTSASNPYTSTRNGSPSMNGNGGGHATGKPCAGCVGKADNKNPKGQYPGGTDSNKGYECDGNKGIGRSNPAHTACQPGTGCLTNCTPPEHHKPCPPPVTHHKPCPPPIEHHKPCPPPITHHKPCPPPVEHHKPCPPPVGGMGGGGETPTPTPPSVSPTGGHGAGIVTAAAVIPVSNVLPDTGLQDSLNWWAVLAVISLLGTVVYWRQFIVPLLPRA